MHRRLCFDILHGRLCVAPALAAEAPACVHRAHADAKSASLATRCLLYTSIISISAALSTWQSCIHTVGMVVHGPRVSLVLSPLHAALCTIAKLCRAKWSSLDSLCSQEHVYEHVGSYNAPDSESGRTWGAPLARWPGEVEALNESWCKKGVYFSKLHRVAYNFDWHGKRHDIGRPRRGPAARRAATVRGGGGTTKLYCLEAGARGRDHSASPFAGSAHAAIPTLTTVNGGTSLRSASRRGALEDFHSAGQHQRGLVVDGPLQSRGRR